MILSKILIDWCVPAVVVKQGIWFSSISQQDIPSDDVSFQMKRKGIKDPQDLAIYLFELRSLEENYLSYVPIDKLAFR